MRTSMVHRFMDAAVLDPESPRLVAAVRASVHCFNTEDEVDRLVRALR
ncbi:hypothetical protein [Kocuria sabuli]